MYFLKQEEQIIIELLEKGVYKINKNKYFELEPIFENKKDYPYILNVKIITKVSVKSRTLGIITSLENLTFKIKEFEGI